MKKLLPPILLVSFLIQLFIFQSFAQPLDTTKHLETGWYFVTFDSATIDIRMTLSNDSSKVYNISPTPIITSKNFIKTKLVSNSNPRLDGLRITLDKAGTDKWNLVTKSWVNGHLAFIVNNKLEYVWYCDHQVTNGIIYVQRKQVGKKRLKELNTYLKENR